MNADYDYRCRVHGQSKETIVPDTEPISWRSIVYGTPVTSNDGVRVGLVHEVLGSDAEDIFHGLRVALTSRHGDVLVSADDIQSMSLVEVRTVLTRSQIDGLSAYDETATYQIGRAHV